MKYPSYDPSIGSAQLDNDGYICNQNLKLTPVLRKALLNKAKRHFRASERSSIQFAADLCRLRDAGVHKRESGTKDFGLWCVDTFPGITRTHAKVIVWQGAVLLILEGHDCINIDDSQPRIGTTGVRKLASLLSNFDEDTLLLVWKRIEQDYPEGKIVEADVVEAMQNEGVFIANKPKPDKGDVTINFLERITDDEEDDYDEEGAERQPAEATPIESEDVEAIMHLHQELVDSFDKLRVKLVKATDPESQPYDHQAIRKYYDEATTLLFELGNLLALEAPT